MGAPLCGGRDSDGCVRCFGTNGTPSPWSSLQPCITAVRPTGTEDSELRAAARRPDGAGAAGGRSHGRLRGCPDAVAGRAAAGRRGR